ncbi:MAG: CvpA family protein [bacterium]|nr:CvpA family protein [bacterium]
MSFNWLDIILLIVILHGAKKGMQKGFSAGIISLMGFVAAGILALHFYKDIGAEIDGLVPIGEGFSGFIAFGIICAMIIFLSIAVQKFFHSVLQMRFAKNFEKYGGAVVGCLKRTLMIGIVFYGCLFAGAFTEVPQSVVESGKHSVLTGVIFDIFNGAYKAGMAIAGSENNLDEQEIVSRNHHGSGYAKRKKS